MTARVRPDGRSNWPALAADAGFEVEQQIATVGPDESWLRLYALRLTNESQLRTELGDPVTDNLMREARHGQQSLPAAHPAQLLIFRRLGHAPHRISTQ